MRFKSQIPLIPPAQPLDPAPPLCRGHETLCVLIAQQDHLVAMDLAAMVEDLGGQVVATAQTGEQTIAQAVRLRPDIAIIDIVLSGNMDGIDAALDIQAECDIPVVFVAGQADAATLQRIHLVSDQPALLKPVSPARMRDAIVSACALTLGR